MANTDMAGHWAARLRDLATDEDIPGAVLGIWADGQQTVAAHGVLNAATGVETTADSLFQIGSITKLWTTTMIMQLIDEGRLSLDAVVADVLPDVRLGREDVSAQVSMCHLLTHTSGIDGDIFTDTGRGDECVERYATGLAGAAVLFAPGEAYSYCNAGFVLLGRIIEELDGRSWDASLRERLIGPLGLTRAVTLPEEAILHRVATGHHAEPRRNEPVAVWGLPRSVGPAGLITASAADVLTFARLHLDGGVAPDGTRLLREEAAAAMLQPRMPMPSLARAEAVGLAWRLHRWDSRLIIGHDGGTIGQTAYLRIDPETRVAACLLTNSAATRSLFERVFSEVFGFYSKVTVPPGPEPPATEPADLDLGRHTGRYERASVWFDLSVRDGRLHVTTAKSADFAAAVDDDGKPDEFDLYPADAAGDNFVCRPLPGQPWTPMIFGRFADGAPYLHFAGRATPRVALSGG